MNNNLIYYAEAQERFVVDPSKYYVFKGEKIYHDPKTDSLIHFDHDGKEIYRKGSFDLRYPCSTTDLNFKNLEKANFSELFNKCSGYSDYLREDIERFSNTNKQGIIIGGCGRSGTTLLNSVIGSHPEVYAIEEETYAFTPTPRLNRASNAISDIKENFWAEKTPKNVQAFSFLSQFNFLKLVHVVRDCRDVILSHHPNHKQQYWVEIERWNEDVQTGLNHEDSCFTIRYEDLVLKTERTLKELCEFLGLRFDRAMLQYQQHTNLKENVAWDQPALPLHAKSVGKWKTTEDKDRINKVYRNNLSVNLLKKLNYLNV